MHFKPLDVYQPLYFAKDNVRYISACGGRGAGRSHNTSEFLIYKITRCEYFRALIMRAYYSDLKKTTWLEFLDRINDTEGLELSDFDINNTEKIIKNKHTGNSITGFGFHKAGGNRKASLKAFANVTHVLIEEAQELTEKELNQIDDSIRTVKAPIKIIFAFNMPDKNHVLIRRFFDLQPISLTDGHGIVHDGYFEAVPKKDRPDHISIFSTYKDNLLNLDEKTIANYERYATENPEHYFNEILGYVSGGAKGLIFKYGLNWFKYNEIPDYDFYETYGLDFGGGGNIENRITYPEPLKFDDNDGNSATVLVRLMINKSSMSVFVKLLVYKAYISPDDLANCCKIFTVEPDGNFVKKKNILADNARADKIRDLINEGLSVIGAKTKEGASNKIVTGIDIMKKYKIYFHEDDTPCHVDANNYKWEVNEMTGESTGNPVKKYENIWDAVRYALVNFDLYSW